jgi:hypothetical protein
MVQCGRGFLGHQDDEEVLVVEGVVHRLAGGIRCSEERVQYPAATVHHYQLK